LTCAFVKLQIYNDLRQMLGSRVSVVDLLRMH